MPEGSVASQNSLNHEYERVIDRLDMNFAVNYIMINT